ncbi:hypothetical protein [Amycolatopsis sp. NPDC006125]|uniref:hypothetical protein n=1 Tax=Amycolatopsis sp. NPDC006125 TaxID=3156730 RepID=UPI0033B69CDF
MDRDPGWPPERPADRGTRRPPPPDRARQDQTRRIPPAANGRPRPPQPTRQQGQLPPDRLPQPPRRQPHYPDGYLAQLAEPFRPSGACTTKNISN